MSETDGLIWAHEVDANGAVRDIGWDELSSEVADGYHWIHLDLGVEEARRWVREDSGLTEIEVQALLAEGAVQRLLYNAGFLLQ